MKFILAAACFVLSTAQAIALVGEVDDAGQFPFVIQIASSYSNGKLSTCSAVASTEVLVSTAAHCVYDTDAGFAKTVAIKFIDPDGVERSAKSSRIFVPQSYIDADRALQAARDNEDRSLKFKRMSLSDIAFIIPDSLVQTAGYMHWGTQLLQAPYSDISTSANLNDPNVRSRIEDTIMAELGGEVAEVEAVVVGFGHNFCRDYAKHEGCSSDGRRRFAKIKIIPAVYVKGERFSSPWLWCTGTSEAHVSPIQQGDSGGPIFVRHKNGRWFFMGYHSGGTYQQNCSSSLFSNLDLFRHAAKKASGLDRNFLWKGSWNRDKSIVRSFLEEHFASWSQPNEQAVPALKQFFDEYSTQISTKEEFALQWPVRKYQLVMETLDIDCNDMWYCLVAGRTKWTLFNPTTDQSKSGYSDIEIVLTLSNSEQAINPGAPQIKGEEETFVAKDAPLPNHPFNGWYAKDQEYCDRFRKFELRDLSNGEASQSELIHVRKDIIHWNYGAPRYCEFKAPTSDGTSSFGKCGIRDQEFHGALGLSLSGSDLIIDFDVPGFNEGTKYFVKCD